ncbi:hypothetical protein CBL_00203 [Carabus blaptoides fortunei]
MGLGASVTDEYFRGLKREPRIEIFLFPSSHPLPSSAIAANQRPQHPFATVRIYGRAERANVLCFGLNCDVAAAAGDGGSGQFPEHCTYTTLSLACDPDGPLQSYLPDERPVASDWLAALDSFVTVRASRLDPGRCFFYRNLLPFNCCPPPVHGDLNQ